MKAHKYEVNMKDDTRIALLEQSIGFINETMTRLEKRFDSMENKIDTLGIVVTQEMKMGFKDVNNRLWTNFFWMVGGFAGVLGLVAHALHWI